MNIEFTIKKERVLLRADALNYELCWLKNTTNKETGEETSYWHPEKYFASLEQALSRVIDLKVRASEARTLAELKKVIEDSRDEVCRSWATGINVLNDSVHADKKEKYHGK